MGKIYCLIGKSASGKDTLYQEILTQFPLRAVVPYTTRPQRTGEVEGETYHFVTDAELAALEQNGEILEKRQYHTVQGLWSYFTRVFPLEDDTDYLLINTPEGVKSLLAHYGTEQVCVVYLHLEDKERLLRCVERESRQKKPNYAELCRRFLTDQADFAEEALQDIPYVTIDTKQPLSACLQDWERLYRGEYKR